MGLLLAAGSVGALDPRPAAASCCVRAAPGSADDLTAFDRKVCKKVDFCVNEIEDGKSRSTCKRKTSA